VGGHWFGLLGRDADEREMTRYTEFLASGFEWLRYQRGCYIVAWERGPWSDNHKPDLIGIDKTRTCIEIEIKRSVADFKHDAEKSIWNQRDLFKKWWPSQFYYFVEPEMVEKVEPLIRDGFGLLTFWPEGGKPTFGGNREIKVVRRATRQKDAKKLTAHQLMNMVRHQSGSMAALMTWIKDRDAALALEPAAMRAIIDKPVSSVPMPALAQSTLETPVSHT
jgi:hypothetical protein